MMIKIVAEDGTGRLLGAQVIGEDSVRLGEISRNSGIVTVNPFPIRFSAFPESLTGRNRWFCTVGRRYARNENEHERAI